MNSNNKNKGFSLVEALVAMAIISFVIVTILGGFSHQQMASRKDAQKNMAVALADMRMQELVKYNSVQLSAVSGVTTEYIVHKGTDFLISTVNPKDPDQMRRTTIVEAGDVLGDLMVIRVLVEYGLKNNEYPFRVVLSTRRGQ